jgi:hypothetical protein
MDAHAATASTGAKRSPTATRKTSSSVADAGSALELGGRALDREPAVGEDADTVGEALGLVEVLGREQHGHPVIAQRADLVPQRLPGDGIEAGGRLVEEDHARRADERGREIEAAAHSARVGPGSAIRRPDELEALQQRRPARSGVRAAQAEQPPVQRQ